jgi:hypothetical protein
MNDAFDLLWMAGAAVSLGFIFYGAFLGLALQRGAPKQRTLSHAAAARPCAS